MADVFIDVDYSALQKARDEAKTLKDALDVLKNSKLDIQTNLANVLNDLDRVKNRMASLSDEIKSLNQWNKAKPNDQRDMSAQIQQWKELLQLRRQYENTASGYRAGIRINDVAQGQIRQEIDAQKEVVKQQEAATKAAEDALAARKKAALEAENASKKNRDAEIKAAEEAARARQKAIEDELRSKEAATQAMHALTQQRIEDERQELEAIREAAVEKERLQKEYADRLKENATISSGLANTYANQQAEEEAREQARLQQEAIQRYQSTMRGISTVLGGAGALSNLTGQFASGIGGAFSGMGGLFGNTNVSTALTRFLTYNALRGVTNNLSGIVSRYDIMSTFLPYMEVAGVGGDAAQVALNRVNQAILGLPIGLDESAQRLRRYQMFLGNVDDATNLTIGAQNAILAGGASEQMKNMAYMQIDRLLAAGRLNTARQWLSLIQGMGVSMRFISEQMGVAGMDVRDLAAGLASGAIDAKEFLNALMELGKGESDAAQGLEATLEIYKGTIEAWINNIQFAATRGGENIMKALNQTLVDATGQGITGYMKNYRDFLNSVFGKADSGGGISGWIMDNPDAIIGVMREGYTVIEALSRFNASDIGLGIAGNTERLFSAIATGLNSIPDGKLEEFVSFATTLAGPVGAGMSQASNLGVMLGVFERFKGFDFDVLTSDMSNAVGDMSNIVNWLLNVGPLGDDNFMSNLLAYGAVFGKPVGSALTTLARGASSLAMLKIAFPSLFKFGASASGGGAGFLASAFESGLPASVEGELAANALWGEAVPSAGTAMGLLVPTLLAGGIFAGLSAADKRNYAQMVNQYGLSNIGSANVDISNALLGARANFSQITTIPALNKANADQQRENIQANIDYLQSLYTEQESYRAVLQDESKQLHAEIDRINNGEGVTTQDIINLPNLEERAKEVDKNLTTVKGNISELNGEIIKEGLALDGLVIKFGDYEISVETTTDVLKEQAEFIPAYVQRMNDLSAATSAAVANAKESFAADFSGLGGIEYPDTPKGGFTTENAQNLEDKAEAAESITTSLNTITRYINGLEPGSETGETLGGYVNEILDIGDIGEQAKQLKEVADGLSGENGIAAGLQRALEAFSSREDALAGLDAALSGYEASMDRFIQKSTDAYNASTQVSEAAIKIGEFKEAMMGFADEAPEAVEQATGAVSSNMENMATKSKDSSDKTVQSAKDVTTGFTNEAGPVTTASQAFGDGAAVGFTSLQGVAEAAAGAVAEATAQIIANLQAAQAAVAELGSVGSGGTTGTTGSLAGSSVAIPSATGGPVFKAFGSDTVPYMLTPGEYIIRKGAADFFGRGLLERINALDIGGAFDRLILNSPVTAGRFGGNVYNKDNHASVVQNYYNSSPDYGNRRAWRFAHSL